MRIRYLPSPWSLYRALRDALRRRKLVTPPAPPVAALFGREYPYRAVNVAIFVAQTAVVFGANAGAFGGRSNKDISQSYKSLVTPAGWAFAIWSVIYLSEAVAVAYMATAEPSALLADMSPAWVIGNLLQLVWALAFAQEQVTASAFILTGVAGAYAEAMRVLVLGGASGLDRLLVLLPVSLHAGWVLAASLVGWNVSMVALRLPLSAQISIAFCTLHGALAIAVAAFVVPLSADTDAPQFRSRAPAPFLIALAWALVAIGQETDQQGDIRIVWPLRRALYFTSNVIAAVIAVLYGMEELAIFLQPVVNPPVVATVR